MEKVVVLDFGGQYAHLIARRVRSLGVYAEIHKPTLTDFSDVKGIILSGGPSSVHDPNAPAYNKEVFQQNVPILGICYGMQLMARDMGGNVTQLPSKEYGKASINILEKKSIFTGLADQEQAWMSHGDSINQAPDGFDSILKICTEFNSIQK